MEGPLTPRVAQGLAWTTLQNWGSQAMFLVVFLLLAHLLEPKDFGLFALAAVFVALMQVFLDSGFAQALVQREDLEQPHLDTAFWTTVALGAALTLLTIASAGLVADLFGQPELASILRWLSLSFVFGALASIPQTILRRRMRFSLLAVRSLVATTVGGVTGVAMAVSGAGVWSLVGQQLSAAAAATLVLWTASDWRPGLRFSLRHLRDIAGFGVSVLGTNLLNVVNRRADDVLIGYVLGPVALGFYTIGYRVLRMSAELFTSTAAQVVFPAFSRLQREPERLRRAFYSATQVTSIVAFPAFVAMAVLAPELVRGLFGEKWDPSVPVLQVLAFIGIVHAVGNLNGLAITAFGRPGWVFWYTAASAVVNVIAFSIAVHWGIVAVAVAFVVRGYLFQPLSLWRLHRLIGIDARTYLAQLRAPLLSALVMAVVMMGLRELLAGASPYTILALAGVAGAAAYFVTIRFVAPVLLRRLFDFARLAMPQFGWRKA